MPLSDRECSDIIDRQGRIEHRLDKQDAILDQVLAAVQELRVQRIEEIAEKTASEKVYRHIGWAVIKVVTFIGFLFSSVWGVFHWYTTEGGSNWLQK